MRNFIPLIARIFMSAIFLKSALGKIMDPAGTQQFMAAHGMPLAVLFLIGAIVLEVAGAISVLIGYKARWGAALLVVFMVPTTLIFHTKLSDPMQMIMFMKNLAIIGGLLMVVYFGAGPVSLDARSRSPGKA